MLIIKKENIQEIPTLQVALEERFYEKLPLVIFLHGFTSGKERNLHYAYKLAEKGLRVLLPDAPLHGERETELSSADRRLQFWDIVVQQIEEVDLIRNEMVARGNIDADRVCLAGTSMGGIVTFGAITQYDWIRAAVSLRGTPTFEAFATAQLNALMKEHTLGLELKEQFLNKIEQLRAYDLSLEPSRLEDCPILIWHGEQDDVVPFQFVDHFCSIISSIPHIKENVTYITDPNSGHEVTRQGIESTVKWIGENL